MNYKSLSLSFRIGLAFHAMNNEGSSGTNVMEPRRISVGGHNYDGISGEMVRRHVFENLVQIVKDKKLNLSTDGEGLLPDRAKNIIRSYLTSPQSEVTFEGDEYKLEPQHLPLVTKAAMEGCAITDIGGYLAAFDSSEKVKIKGATPKRDSVFDVGWLISEEPAIVEFAQHAAYRPDGQHNLFTQNMRAAVYGGVARLDLGRIGYNDWAWLVPTPKIQSKDDLQSFNLQNVKDLNKQLENELEGILKQTTPEEKDTQLGAFSKKIHDLKWHLLDEERKNRARALIDAWEQWLLSPAGAKQAGWLQHTGQLEGVIVLSNFGPAPFRSPIEVELDGETQAIRRNRDFISNLEAVGTTKPNRYKTFKFTDQASLIRAFDTARQAIGLEE